MDEMLIWGTSGVVLSSVLLAAYYTAVAMRAEHLLLLHSPTHGIWLFERGANGVYERVSIFGVPAAVARFAGSSTGGRLVPARQRISHRSARLRTAHAAGVR